MLAKDAFEDIRNYIKQRIAYAVYYIGNETQEVNLTSVEILDNGADNFIDSLHTAHEFRN